MKPLISILCVAVLWLSNSLASIPETQEPRHPAFSYRQEAMVVPGLPGWQRTHVLSFPFPLENELPISAVELVGKKSLSEIDRFATGFCPAGSLFCFSIDYDPATKMMSIFLAEEPNSEEWSDDLCEMYEIEKTGCEFTCPVYPEYEGDDWFYYGYIPDERKVDFLEWISVKVR